MDSYGFLVEGRVESTSSGLLIAGINGRDPVTSIKQLSRRLEGLEQKTVILGYHPPKGCMDYDEHLGISIGLHETRELITSRKPLVYITSRLSRTGYCKLGQTIVASTGWLRKGKYLLIELPILRIEEKTLSYYNTADNMI